MLAAPLSEPRLCIPANHPAAAPRRTAACDPVLCASLANDLRLSPTTPRLLHLLRHRLRRELLAARYVRQQASLGLRRGTRAFIIVGDAPFDNNTRGHAPGGGSVDAMLLLLAAAAVGGSAAAITTAPPPLRLVLALV